MKSDILTQIAKHVDEALTVHESHGHAERIEHMHGKLEAIRALIENADKEPEAKATKPEKEPKA